MDIKETEEVVKTVMGFTAKQITVVIFLICFAVSGAFWVEHRYAKLKETEESIKRHKDEILQIHFKMLELIKLQPKATQDEIDKNVKQYLEQLHNLEQQVGESK